MSALGSDALNLDLFAKNESENSKVDHTINKKFMETIENVSREYKVKNGFQKIHFENLDSYISLTKFLENNESNDYFGSYSKCGISKNFKMFDPITLNQKSDDSYLKKIYCEPKQSSFNNQSAYKLM